MNITFKTLLISLIVNFILIVLKISIGLIGSSRALIADGLHSFTDLVTDLVGIIGHRYLNVQLIKNIHMVMAK